MWLYQLKVIIWKNLIIRKRHWFLTICETLTPVLLFLFIAYGRSKITGLSKQHIVAVTYNEAYPISFEDMGFNFQETYFYYAPNDPYFGDILQRTKEKCQIPTDNVLGFKSETNLFEKYAKSNNGTTVAILFNSKPSSPNFDYTIRIFEQFFSWKTDQLYRNSFVFQPGQGSDYTWKGFLVLQTALDVSFIEKEKENQGGTVPKLNLEALEFPYPPYKSDSGLSSVFIMWLPLITLFSFIFVCPVVLKRVVEEKYTGIKELMRMVGMKSWMLWFGWFIYSVMPMFISVLLIVVIMKVDLFQASYPAIEYTSSAILIVFLSLYCVAITINCFFLSTLFYKPTLATLAGILFWILSYFVPKYLLLKEDGNVFSTSMWLMLLPNMALHYGYVAISNYEIREIGVQWSNWHIPGGNGVNEISMLNVCLMLIIDCLVYLILALYVDQINPGKYGVPQSVFFPIKWIYSVLRRRSNNIDVVNDAEAFHLKEVEKGRLPRGIELVGLTKSYGKNTVVKQLSLDIYQDQITVLLGHNGAGKSTTMGMITGMIKKSSGRIIINGKEIDSRSDITQSIGLCPQHNLFFSDLTVVQHLMFFAMLRGLDYKTAEEESKKLLKTLNIDEKSNEKAKNLSGGMKRKLCLGMAVIGEPKILILDEPSSGMDPQSRRYMWDLLLKWRNNKTILITTHFMEEADALGDWIAIMNEGKLLCYGTPMYLKKVYDTGSNLVLLIKEDQKVDRVIADIEREISLSVPNVKCKSINGNEVQFLIPSGDYVKMFEHLESNKETFHIENISFNNTTLEDVFLNSKIDADKLGEEENDGISLNESSDSSNSYFLTLQALLFKRYCFIYRKFMSYIIPSLIALGFLLLCIFLGQNASDYSNSGGPALKMALSSYGKTSVYFSTKSNGQKPTSLAQFYQHTVEHQKSNAHLVDDVNAAIVKEGILNLPYYQHHMVAAAQFSLEEKGNIIDVTAMYNNWAIHSLPISVNLITNSLAKLTLGSNYSISTINDPLPSINSQVSEEELSEFQIGLLWLIIMPLGFLFFLGSFIFFPFMEMSTNFTQIQFMCGVPQSVYWFITFICDFAVYFVFAFVMAIITLLWTPFRGINEFGALFLILFMYGLSGIPYSYVFARKKSFSASYALFVILGIMLGVLLTFAVLAMEMSQDQVFMDWAHALKIIAIIFCPPFSLTYYGVQFSQRVIKNYNFKHMGRLKLLSMCSRESSSACCKGESPQCDAERSYMNVLNPDIWYVLLGATVYLALNMFLDSYMRKCLTNRMMIYYKTLRYGGDKSGDPDASCVSLNDDCPNTDTLRVKKLKKSYSGRQVVNNVSLSLKKGECMGILGVNGAGKTTTFRMLTRDEVKDNGEIRINDVNVDSEEYLKKMGYCPQNDALNYSLTGRDILKTVSMLRGIKDDTMVENFLDTFGLKEFADIPCDQYSGGNKRKLSFAVAVIGFPEFILLDEPTNGVDPLSRRKFWTLIKDIKKKKQISFMLTSHSMAECEAVCNDLKIMKQGTIKKQGTISKLKNEVSGFNVMLKLKQPGASDDDTDGPSEDLSNVNELKAKLKEWYRDGEIRDEHSGLLHFYIKSEDKKWSELFKQFENLKNRNRHLIEDYSISEASLEDVFLSVAQPDEEENVEPSLFHV